MNVNELKKYLEAVIEIEKSIYTQKSVIREIDDSIALLGRSQRFSKIEPPRQGGSEVYSYLAIAGTFLVFGVPLLLIGSCLSGDFLFDCLSVPMIVLSVPAIIGAIISVIVFFRKLAEEKQDYRSAVEEYKRKINRQNSQIARDKERVNSELLVVAPRLAEQRELLASKLVESKRILDEIYALDVIYIKYRNLIAVCSFYDYIASGRCSSLEGHEGAYNVFENQIRLDLIIYKLDVVISKLEDIKESQYALYHALSESNQLTKKLVKNVQSLSRSVDYAAQQTAIAAENSRWAADELSSLKRIKLLFG